MFLGTIPWQSHMTFLEIREEKRKARAAMGNVDSIQTKLAQAEQEKARKLKAMETTTRTMMETTDIVKAQMERAEELKEDQMKQFEQMVRKREDWRIKD